MIELQTLECSVDKRLNLFMSPRAQQLKKQMQFIYYSIDYIFYLILLILLRLPVLYC